jgi:hypothetical protein
MTGLYEGCFIPADLLFFLTCFPSFLVLCFFFFDLFCYIFLLFELISPFQVLTCLTLAFCFLSFTRAIQSFTLFLASFFPVSLFSCYRQV